MNEEKRNQVIYFSNNTCVSCGKDLPEGQMVCQQCMDEEDKEVKVINYTKIKKTKKQALGMFALMLKKLMN